MLVRKKIEPARAYCKHGVALCDDPILCVKKGVRTPDTSCRRFQYDPFKRIPAKPKAMDFSRYNEDDFSL